VKIRDFAPRDYPAIVDIHNGLNIVWPEYPRTPAAWEKADHNRSSSVKYRRWVALEDDRVVGFAAYRQGPVEYPPNSFWINVEVAPEYQRRGIGSALFDEVRQTLLVFNPSALRADAFTNLPQGYSFLQKRGFYEAFRETPVHLEISTFDARIYESLESKLKADGIVIKTLRELETGPDRGRKLYDLYWQAWSDVPQEGDPSQKPDFDEWLSWGLNGPSVLPDAYFIALDGDVYIGLRELEAYSDSDTMMGGLLGVLPKYRNRGIGLALQLRGIAYAREDGYRFLKTCTAIQNAPMQALFDKLGYTRDPEWQQCQKDLT
jgi:GNAT superfamily N-acetyltransferase